MKKPTIREMRWIDKGFIKNFSYNRFEAKANNSLFITESNENFEVTCKILKTSSDQGFVINVTPQTYFSITISQEIKINTSIKGYSSTTYLNNTQYLDNNLFVQFKIVRIDNSFSFFLWNKDHYQLISNAKLNGANNAISFGFIMKNNIYLKVEDFYYKRLLNK